jgi:hypothetical protein
MAVGPADSLIVSLAGRLDVFGPDLAYARTTTVPATAVESCVFWRSRPAIW